MPDVTIKWICDVDRDRANLLRAGLAPGARVLTSIDQAPDVDIALMAIPVGFRAPLIEKMFARGWHVFCEKPFAVSVREHQHFVSKARAAGVKVGVGLMRRFYASTIACERLVDSRVLGDVKRAWATYGNRVNRTDRSDWYQSDARASGGGVLMESGSHVIDQLFLILGVTGFDVLSCQQTTFKNLETETTATASLHTTHQHDVPLSVAISQRRDLYSGLNILFSKALVRMGNLPSDKVALLDCEERHIGNLDTDGATDVYQAFFLEWREFIEHCQSQSETSRVGADSTLQSVAFIESCYRTASRFPAPLESLHP